MAAKLFFLQIQHQSRVYQIFVQNSFGLLLHDSLFTGKRNSDVLYYYPALRAPRRKQKGNFPAPARWCRGRKRIADERC